MLEQFFQLLGSTVFPSIIGMVFANLRRKPGTKPIPAFASGGGVLFLKTWAVTFISALLFGQLFLASGASESYTSALGHLVLPAVCATFFVRGILESSKHQL